MNANDHNITDLRITEALRVVMGYALGNYKTRGIIFEQSDIVDTLITGINMLGEELDANIAELKQSQENLIATQEQLVRKEKLSVL